MRYTFIGCANGNKQHVLVSIYRTWYKPFENQMQFWVGVDGQARVKSVMVATVDPLTEIHPIPLEVLNEACRLQGVEFMGWLA